MNGMTINDTEYSCHSKFYCFIVSTVHGILPSKYIYGYVCVCCIMMKWRREETLEMGQRKVRFKDTTHSELMQFFCLI